MPTGMTRGHVRWGLALQTSGQIGSGAITTATVPLYAVNDPPVKAEQTILESEALDGDGRHATNRSRLGIRTPSVSGLEIPWNSYCVPHILATLFQYGADTAGSKAFLSKATTMNPIYLTDTCGAPGTGYTSPQALTLMRIFSQTSAYDHYLHGAICKSMTISADTSGFIMASCDFIGFGYSWAASVTAASSNADTYGLIHPFVNFGSIANTITLGGSAIQVRSLSLTVSNGATAKHWNYADPQMISFGRRFEVTGELSIICDPANASYPGLKETLATLIGRTEKTLIITCGDGTGDPNLAGEWKITTNFIPTAEPETVENDNVYDIRVPFKGVYTNPGSPDISILLHNGVTGWAS